jgi:hypothetical protein
MASIGALLNRGQAKSEEFLRNGLDTWVVEGRIEETRRAQLIASMNTPEVERALLHVGVHFAISLPLRFPLGASARFLYTLGLRLKAEFAGLMRRGSPRQARRLHTLPVMLFSLLPGFGRLAYFLSPSLNHERLLMVVPLDIVARKLPFKTYPRLHLDSLFTYWAQPGEAGRGFRHFLYGGWFQDLSHRLGELRPYGRFIAAVLLIDMTAFLIGVYLYVDSDEESVWWFDERNVMATLNAGQLVAGGILGLMTYRLFWRRRRGVGGKEAAGIFLWGIGGAGLILFALDDYASVHESLGHHFESAVNALPVAVNMPDDLLVLAYGVIGLSVLFVFRMELFEDRASATLLQLAALASLVMVVTDAFATTRVLKALEFPSQMLANGLLLLAFSVRYLEVTRGRATVADQADRVKVPAG